MGLKNEGDRCNKTSNIDIKLMQMEKTNPLLNTGWEVGWNHFITAFGGQRVAGWGMLPLQDSFLFIQKVTDHKWLCLSTYCVP